MMQSIKCESQCASLPERVHIQPRDSRDTVGEITFSCVSNDFKCALSLSPADKVSHLTTLLAQRMEILPARLLLICRGTVLSRRPSSSLASFGLAAGRAYKLVVIRRPVRPAWLRITAHVLCSSLPAMDIPMLSSSTAADFKRELRELLRIPSLCLSLHLADGEALPDGASLGELGVGDGERVYCCIHTEDPPPAAAVDAAQVREQIRRAEGAAEHGGGGPKQGGEGARDR